MLISEFMINDMIMLNNRNIKMMKSNKLFDHKNLRSFKIIKVYNNSIYHLKLLASMKRFHFVFYL